MAKRVRRHDRRGLTRYLKVVSGESGKDIGYLADMSEKGMLVLSKEFLETNTGKVFALEIVFPEDLDGRPGIAVSARSVWSRRDQATKLFATGFRVVRLDADGRKLWKAAVEKYGIES